jgi:3-hydroxyisobutyrate dehydrogenase
MAACLSGHFQVFGYDPSPQRAALGGQAGISVCANAQQAASDAQAVLLAVRNEAQLAGALFGEDGVAGVLAPGAVVILTSTVGIDAVRRTAPLLDELGIGLVDSPISGGPIRAGRGDLLIIVGASPAHLAKVQGILEQLSSTLTVVGDQPGDGQALKTVNQLLCGVHIAAAAEALALAQSLGLDLSRVLDALGAGAAASFMLADRGPRIIAALSGEEPPVLSRADIFVKDLGIVEKAARAGGVATPVAAAAEQLYLLAQAAGGGARDDSSIASVLRGSK